MHKQSNVPASEAPWLEPSGTPDGYQGRDPRTMSGEEMERMGFVAVPILRAIRANCIDCSGGSEAEVRRCRAASCPLWPYRMATNPFRQKRELQPEEREKAAARLATYRGKRAPSSDTDI